MAMVLQIKQTSKAREMDESAAYLGSQAKPVLLPLPTPELMLILSCTLGCRIKSHRSVEGILNREVGERITLIVLFPPHGLGKLHLLLLEQKASASRHKVRLHKII